jgi:putative tryptophan/tyrosine transport system substrate-binding protein
MQSELLKRRDFITLLGSALAWSCGAEAQERAPPVIGFLSAGSPGSFRPLVDAFREALSEGGHVEGRNVAIEYRWAEGQMARLPEMASDLVRRRVALFATGGTITARAAQAATSTIPILFISGPDPVADGLAKSFSRPGGNLTGVAIYTSELMPKRLELLNELVPRAKTIALLVNPADIANKVEVPNIQKATHATGQQLVVLEAGSARDIESAFDLAVKHQASGLLISANPFFTSQLGYVVALAARHAIPTAYPWSQYVEAGGLMSYGPSIAAAYQLIGRYASRILKGESPSDLPVQMPTKFDLTINLKTAKSLGLSVPRTTLIRADNVIE